VLMKTLLSRTAVICALAWAASSGCSAISTPKVMNEVCDSELRNAQECWNVSRFFAIRAGLGPNASALLYYPGTGRASGFHADAAFLARVHPGATYTFSAYVDSSGYVDGPPYVLLSAVNGSWAGTKIFQTGKGRISVAFTLPASSHTTLIQGIFSPENATYPVGRGAAFSQPQVEIGDQARPYVHSNDPIWDDGPVGGNQIINSEASKSAQYWTLVGAMKMIPAAGPHGNVASVYAGTGKPSGFNNAAIFLAQVTPGLTYTFSAYVDGADYAGSPPFVTLEAGNGRWAGTSFFQTRRGRIFTTFVIPATSHTTFLRGTFNPENGRYKIGTSAVFAEPQLEQGSFPHAYRVGSDGLSAPPGGNLIPDSEARRAPYWTYDGRMHQANGVYADGASAIILNGNGKPAGYGDRASVRARVQPGKTYTLTADIDGSSDQGTPPYVFISAVNGSWKGAQAYQPGRGYLGLTFALPAQSATTCINIRFEAENGTYPLGTSLVITRPQLALGSEPYRYVPSSIPSVQAGRCG